MEDNNLKVQVLNKSLISSKVVLVLNDDIIT